MYIYIYISVYNYMYARIYWGSSITYMHLDIHPTIKTHCVAALWPITNRFWAGATIEVRMTLNLSTYTSVSAPNVIEARIAEISLRPL